MTAGLLLPAALAALAALALPLLLHIARRSEQRRTDFAALQWLREHPRPRHRLRFDERLLLAARLVLLALLALWLARPVLFGSADARPWIVAIPGVDPAEARARARGKVRARWLAPGFPALDAAPPAGVIPFASLLRELDATLPSGVRLTVLAPQVLQGADAERPRLSRAIEWRVLGGTMPASAAASSPPPMKLVVRHGGSDAAGARYLRAVALAWRSGAPADVAASSVPLPASARQLAWLVPGRLPEVIRRWIESGGTALVAADTRLDLGQATIAWRDAEGVPLVEAASLGRGRVLRFARPLAPMAMPELLDPRFPERLRALFEAEGPPPSRVAARDYAPTLGGVVAVHPARDLQPWLALLIAGVALVERWLATARRRAVSP